MNDFKEKKIKDDLYELPSNYAGYVPLDAVVKYIIQRDDETRKETIGKMSMGDPKALVIYLDPDTHRVMNYELSSLLDKLKNQYE